MLPVFAALVLVVPLLVGLEGTAGPTVLCVCAQRYMAKKIARKTAQKEKPLHSSIYSYYQLYMSRIVYKVTKKLSLGCIQYTKPPV